MRRRMTSRGGTRAKRRGAAAWQRHRRRARTQHTRRVRLLLLLLLMMHHLRRRLFHSGFFRRGREGSAPGSLSPVHLLLQFLSLFVEQFLDFVEDVGGARLRRSPGRRPFWRGVGDVGSRSRFSRSAMTRPTLLQILDDVAAVHWR